MQKNISSISTAVLKITLIDNIITIITILTGLRELFPRDTNVTFFIFKWYERNDQRIFFVQRW